MSSLPPEILDLIVDHLGNEPDTLKSCCLASKSWVPRSRLFLFARVELQSTKSSITSWMKAFPDPSNSPAHYTRTLSIHMLMSAPTSMFTWLLPFCRIEELVADVFGWEELDGVSLAQLHGLSPTLKSLDLSRVGARISDVIDLICSFPLLESFSIHFASFDCNIDGWTAPLTSPKLTGSLRLNGEIRYIARALLDLPGGLHFSNIWARAFTEDVDSRTIMDLISKCSDTLESLSIWYIRSCTFPPSSPADQCLTVTHIHSRVNPDANPTRSL